MLSFRSPFFDFFPRPFPLSGEVLIAPFWDDFDVRQGGQILFRQTDDEILLERVGSSINDDFSPALLFIATWDRVPRFSLPSNVILRSKPSNSAQLAYTAYALSVKFFSFSAISKTLVTSKGYNIGVQENLKCANSELLRTSTWLAACASIGLPI